MKSCFFIGHREAGGDVFPALSEAVEHHITEHGVTDFYVGHYGGFDGLAAQAVKEARERHPEIRLTLVLPYHPAIRPINTPKGFDGTFYPWEEERIPKRLAITVKLSGIPAMAQRTVFATAQDNNKPLLKCVNLKFTNVGLRAAGSNGNCIVTAKGDDQSKGDISLLIPATSLGKLARMCADKDEFRVGTTGKNIVFFKENFLFSARLMEGGYIDTDLLLSTIKNSFTVLTDIQDLRNALSSVLTVEPEGRVRLGFKDQRLEFYCGGKYGTASAPVDVIALTGAPVGDFWFSSRQLSTCLKALTGTVTLGIAGGGMLTLSTQDAFYMQSAMRTPTEKKTEKPARAPAAKAA